MCVCIKRDFSRSLRKLSSILSVKRVQIIQCLRFKLKTQGCSIPSWSHLFIDVAISPVPDHGHLCSVSCGCFLPPCVPVINGRAELGPVSSPLCLLLFWDSLPLSATLVMRQDINYRPTQAHLSMPRCRNWFNVVALLWAISISHGKDWGPRALVSNTELVMGMNFNLYQIHCVFLQGHSYLLWV